MKLRQKGPIFMNYFFKKILSGFLLLIFLLPGAAAAAGERILFIPHDNRPISCRQTAEVIEGLGYEVLTPPAELLGGEIEPGDPDALWSWAEEHIKGSDAAVISTDALIYGGLTASRKHHLPQELLEHRVSLLRQMAEDHPGLRLYAFASLMRTPKNGLYAGREEPDYYQEHGAGIFSYTALLDKEESEGLSKSEKLRLEEIRQELPAEVIGDWMDRRAKNLRVTKELLELTRRGTFRYFIIGKDDNAPHSQTHREALELQRSAGDLPETSCQILAGIDEFSLLLLTRAVNDMEGTMPFVFVDYNIGKGRDTIPTYSDEPLHKTIRSDILAAGGVQIQNPEHADLVLLVNTNPDGSTGEANGPAPGAPLADDGKDRPGSREFVKKVQNAISSYPAVGVADIAYNNGSDNALMRHLQERGLLFRLHAYSGWNTATNSTGFAIGMGMLTPRMDTDTCDRLLLRRYLDDWCYQANIRTSMEHRLKGFREGNIYGDIRKREAAVEERVTALMRSFATEALPPFRGLSTLEVSFPWHRMFEADISLGSSH